MNVLQPGMLWLLAAAAIPIVIHLYNRKRAVRRRFPPIEFLLASNQKLARKLKVRQLVLLALRVGVFALLPLAIAKPYFLSDSGTTLDERLPGSVVFVLDDSLSMGESVDGSSAFDRGRDAVLERLDGLRDIDEAALVLASSPDDPPVLQLTDDLRVVRDAVDETRLSGERGDLQRALEVARDIALTSELPVRRVVLVTDLARGSWPDTLAGEVFHGTADVELVDIGPGSPTTNLAVTEVTWGQAPRGGAGQYEVRATVTGFALEGDASTEVELEIDGELVGKTTAELSADSPRTEVVFDTTIEGTARGVVRLTDGGSIPDDDLRHLVLTGSRQVRVLLVNGDPRPQPLQDELFFIEKALRPGAESRSPILPRVTTPEGLSVTDLDQADVVVLSNVHSLPAAQVDQVRTFVRDGGGLFVTLGDRVDPGVANTSLGDLLPKPLRSRKLLTEFGDPDAAIKVTRVDEVQYSHPVFRPFALPGGESMQQVEVSSYMLLEPEARGDARILASYADGGPAIVERSLGAGRIVLLTTTIDRDWSSLPLRKAFVPFVQRMATYLARRGDAGTREATVGEPHTLALDAIDADAVSIVDDTGRAVATFEAEDLRLTPNPSVVLDAAGHYEMRVSSGGVELEEAAAIFAANPDPLEFDTGRIDEDEVAELWAAPPPDSDDDSIYAGAGRERRVELWPILLLTVLILLYLESLVGFRRSFLRRLTKRAA